jgi:endonuclease/exonuclease/phosphatase family metal-dependent hydrolase
MLAEFIYKQDLDVILLQEVTNQSITMVQRYIAYTNLGTEGRGTAILTKDVLQAEQVERSPSGRGIAIKLKGVWYINVYAPSGAEKQTERENFFNTEIIMILPTAPDETLIAGDFNCINNNNDSTGNAPRSKALERILNGLELKVAWDTTKVHNGFTHYAPLSATRLDRIYITKLSHTRKCGVEMVATSFTDHFAVVIRLATDVSIVESGRGYWKMKASLLHDRGFCEVLRDRWTKWKTYKRYYPNAVKWWTVYVKGQIKKFFAGEGAVRRQDRLGMENFYYDAMYAAIGGVTNTATLCEILKELKGRIIQSQHGPNQRLLLDTDGQDEQLDETPTLFHLMRQRKRQQSRHIGHVNDSNEKTYTSAREIRRGFTEHLQQTFDTIKVETHSIQALFEGVKVQIAPEANEMIHRCQ